MFDLDDQIARWRRAMTEGGVGDSAVLDELESHLRDHVTHRLRLGKDLEQSFKEGVERVGQPGVLKREFLRADNLLRLAGLMAVVDDRRKSFWLAAIMGVLVTGIFYCRNALITPVFESAASVQLSRRPVQAADVVRPQVQGNDFRSVEEINSILHLLASDHLRTRVAASLSPVEQEIVRRPAPKRAIFGAPRSVGNEQLGALRVMSMRRSVVVNASVVHGDAEGAALIANRYVEQCQVYLQDIADPDGIFVWVIDTATPSRFPIVPNLPRILQISICLGLVTFLGVVAVAAGLRKRGPLLKTIGPQVKTS